MKSAPKRIASTSIISPDLRRAVTGGRPAEDDAEIRLKEVWQFLIGSTFGCGRQGLRRKSRCSDSLVDGKEESQTPALGRSFGSLVQNVKVLGVTVDTIPLVSREFCHDARVFELSETTVDGRWGQSSDFLHCFSVADWSL
jgi:hypothetical protein